MNAVTDNASHCARNVARLVVLLVLAGAALAAQAATAATSTAVGGHRVAMVTVVDHTNGTWPGITAVVDGWRRSRYVDARVAPECRARTYCVTVEADTYGATDWHGQTWPTSATSATVQLNLSIPADAALQSAVWCHEMGHTLGIAHPDDSTPAGRWGCIGGTAGGHPTPTPSRADMAQVTAIHTGHGVQGVPQGWGAMYVLPYVGRWRY
jgi:hypothetical protein